MLICCFSAIDWVLNKSYYIFIDISCSNMILIFFFNFLFNATFSNISVISWRPVLVVEEAGVPGENHRTWASN